MDSKRTSRRDLLKASVALAGGATLGTLGKAHAQHDHAITPVHLHYQALPQPASSRIY
jgi:hypothetical protein